MGVAAIAARGTNAVVDWAVGSRPISSEQYSGDMHLVKALPGEVLLAVVDGLGHGAEATEAAEVAIDALTERAPAPLEALVRFCHERTQHTRGVALTLASIEGDGSRMSWLGVGNVEGVLLPANTDVKRETVMQRSGIVGYRLPTLQSSTLPVQPGDLLLLATDGISSDFTDVVDRDAKPSRIADDILGTKARMNDDALVLVARIRKL
ncbi:MAG: SpoIIE family protein phosphatase [Gaiellaceae bacterium]